MTLDLLVFGDTAIDYFYTVNKIPKLNEAGEVAESHTFYGGMGANTAVIANSLGLRTGLVSVIGTDAEDYRKYMENLGVRLCLKGIFGDTTRSMFFKNNGDQVSFFYKGVTEKLDEVEPGKDFELDLLKKAKVAYMARTYLTLQEKVAKYCRNKYLVFNPGYGVFKFTSIPKSFMNILKMTNVLVLNHHELEHLSSLGFKISVKLGPKIFLITRGREGCTIYANNTEVDIGPFKTTVVDASGAGDAFNAGLVAGIIRGHDVYDSVKIGNAAASFVVEKWGCQTNLPSWEQVMARRMEIK